ncbi:bsd domain-containing protein [Diplodia corticola]|uniref:Bsd domain-containing protein n=1 Tax=Diplodia corticola TaxID=236234 RepID=A0A1J9QTZ1_9PEZI|nr:bsd domain-containing protein [Diplodia corticola]OJD31458.1 bsd domain-containing protein [Diplodia corticola]
MDVAYDHIQEETFPDDDRRDKPAQPSDKPAEPAKDFNTEVQDAYKAISNSPWAARIGGLWGTGETYYETARQQSGPALEQAGKGLTDLRTTVLSHTRNISASLPQIPADDAAAAADTKKTIVTDKDGNTIEVNAPAAPEKPAAETGERAESLPADIVKEAEGMLSRLRGLGAERLKDIQKAEDAADEALLRFGTNIRSFLREAVTITGPDDADAPAGSSSSKVLFESKDAQGKRVIHTTRFDAQLHAIHSALESFLKDPDSPEWEGWIASFDIDKKTADISKDLEKYPELRVSMEALVPEKVEYKPFWTRYYFLRHVIESEEQRRREMLKASASGADEEVGWDDDSEDEADRSSSKTSTPNPLATSQGTLKPTDPAAKAVSSDKDTASRLRNSDERSQADSDASYDLVSGATSKTPGSPKEKKNPAADDSDEDWE